MYQIGVTDRFRQGNQMALEPCQEFAELAVFAVGLRRLAKRLDVGEPELRLRGEHDALLGRRLRFAFVMRQAAHMFGESR